MTDHTAGDHPSLIETSLDLPDAALEGEPGRDGFEPRSWRALLGWSATSAPVGVLLLTGLAFGPAGANLLSTSVLASLDPVLPIAVAALGVLVGLSVGDRQQNARRVFAASSLGAALTVIVVSAGIAGVALVAGVSLPAISGAFAVAAGTCAASALTLPGANPLEPRSMTARVVVHGVIVPIAIGGFLVARLRAESAMDAMVLLAQASGVTVALALAAWLLLTRVASDTEERVFAVSALLLIGGVAAALSLSALAGGLVAGVFWRYAGGRPRETIGRDVLFVQHPLLVLVLLVAGARTELSLISLGLGASYLVLRMLGQLAGGLVATRIAGAPEPAELVLRLLSPGVFGVAFALNTAGAQAGLSLLLDTVVIGTIGSELVAPLLSPRSARE